jgi:hypothetical protein
MRREAFDLIAGCADDDNLAPSACKVLALDRRSLA